MPIAKAVTAKVLSRNVDVHVNGVHVDIGSQSAERPEHAENSYTYSRFPCIIVSSIRIAVDGTELFVPRSAFADLSDVTNVEVTAVEKQMLLTLKGGDASEAYSVKIVFSKDRVVKRLFYSALQDAPLQETNYFKTEELN